MPNTFEYFFHVARTTFHIYIRFCKKSVEKMNLSLASGSVVLPGDIIAELSTSGEVTLGDGVMHRASSESAEFPTLICTKAGILSVESSALPPTQGTYAVTVSVRTRGRIYLPAEGDLVVGVVQKDVSGSYVVDVNTAHNAVLSHVGFDGATRQNRPRLYPGDTIYARVLTAYRDMEPEIICCASVGVAHKDWVTGEGEFGALKGGNVVAVSPHYARHLLRDKSAVLEALSRAARFEVAIGLNGRVWVHADTTETILTVSHVLQISEKLDERQLEETIAKLFSSRL